MRPEQDLDSLDGCDVNMREAETTPAQLARLLGPTSGAPQPDETEAEHELRHEPG